MHLGAELWVAERPFTWNGIDVGGKMAVARLSDGSLWVHSPVGLDDALRSELAGPQSHLILFRTDRAACTFTNQDVLLAPPL
jgi:hypothetical protein